MSTPAYILVSGSPMAYMTISGISFFFKDTQKNIKSCGRILELRRLHFLCILKSNSEIDL